MVIDNLSLKKENYLQKLHINSSYETKLIS